MALAPVYIVAARRTALGRLGGLHRNRRLADLASPVIGAVLDDARLKPQDVDEFILGNTMESGNPARVVGLAAGLPEHVAALTIDRACGSGLDAILAAVRIIGAGDAQVVVAGGAESVSTAPWRLAKPKSLYMTPRFLGADGGEDVLPFEALEGLAQRLGIGRMRQDAYALQSYLRAEAARGAKRFVGEIVPIRANADEARDQSTVEPTLEELERLTPFLPPGGTLTPGNTSAPHDGAAFVVAVSEAQWNRLGSPKALVAVGSGAEGVSPEDVGLAPVAALKLALGRSGLEARAIGRVEMSESSSLQALALADSLGFDDGLINPDGGAVVRGHAAGAAGAVSAVRLFSAMVRGKATGGTGYGAVAVGAPCGLGVAAIFRTAAG